MADNIDPNLPENEDEDGERNDNNRTANDEQILDDLSVLQNVARADLDAVEHGAPDGDQSSGEDPNALSTIHQGSGTDPDKLIRDTIDEDAPTDEDGRIDPASFDPNGPDLPGIDSDPPGSRGFDGTPPGEGGDGTAFPTSGGGSGPDDDDEPEETSPPTAQTPSLSADDVSGDEDSAIALDIDAALRNNDGGSETLSVTITGVPAGAALSAGTDNSDGSWTVDPGDLAGLSITPPANSDADFDLSVTATSREANGSIASNSSTFHVDVAAIADAPTLNTSDAAGTEDTAIDLDIASALTDLDGSESLSITVSGVPSGASLSAGSDNGDGSWTLSSGDLDGLTITPPLHSDVDFQLGVSATSTEADGGDTATTQATIDVSVTADADAPTLSAELGSGELTSGGFTVTNHDSDALYDSSYGYVLLDGDGNPTSGEVIWGNVKDHAGESFTLDGVDQDSVLFFLIPDGAGQNPGLDDNTPITVAQDSDGVWQVLDGDGNPLGVRPGNTVHFSEPAFNVGGATYVGTTSGTGNQNWEDLDATHSANDADQNDANFTVIFEPTGVVGFELDIATGLVDTDTSEALEVTVSGLPDGASLSAGSDNGDGSWTLSAAQLSGLTLFVVATNSEAFDLNVTATATEGANDDSESTSVLLSVPIADVFADTPTLTVDDSSGTEDGPIGLDIAASIGDLDGSETLSVVISDVPEGAVLSAGTDNGDGSWTLTPEQLEDLTVTPPPDSDADFRLTVKATSTESHGGDSEEVTGWVDVTVDASADAPTLTVQDASGTEDQAISLDITSALTDTDGSESLSITISGVPSGASLSAGTDNGDGSWTLDSGDLSGLTITPPADSDADFTLNVTATSTDGSDTASTLGTIDVSVAADADTPTLTANDATVVAESSGDDTLTGGAGNDIIDGGGGSDTAVFSGDRANYTVTDNGDGSFTVVDSVGGRDGTDTVSNVETFQFADSSNSSANVESFNVVPASVDTIVGGLGDDTLYGDSDRDYISGGSGDDKLYSGDGADSLDGGSGKDTLEGGAGDGNDVIYDGEDNDKAYGGDGNDTFYAGGGDDSFYGDAGNDIFIFGDATIEESGSWTAQLDGGDGDDTLNLSGMGDSWTIHVDGGPDIVSSDPASEYETGSELSGTVELEDGSTITFEGVEKLEW